MSVVHVVIRRCPGGSGGRRQCSGATEREGPWEPDAVQEAGPVAGKRTALGQRVDSRREDADPVQRQLAPVRDPELHEGTRPEGSRHDDLIWSALFADCVLLLIVITYRCLPNYSYRGRRTSRPGCRFRLGGSPGTSPLPQPCRWRRLGQ